MAPQQQQQEDHQGHQGHQGHQWQQQQQQPQPQLQSQQQPDSQRPSLPTGRNALRFMTVDNVLQYASDIPSARPRHPHRPATSSPATTTALPQLHGSAPASQRRLSITGGGSSSNQGGAHVRAAQPLPSRTTKISEKLVLLPETTSTSDEDDSDENLVSTTSAAQAAAQHEAARRHQTLDGVDEDAAPLRDEELDVLRKRGGIRGKSYAERLPKPRRAEEKVARVTAYCTAEAFRVKEVADFVRKRHEAKTKLYDDCLYTVYALPLLPGTDGFRLRSKPVLRTPGSSGKTVLDLEIERSEQRDHHEGFYDDYGFGRQNGGGGGGGGGGDSDYHGQGIVDDVGLRNDAMSPMSPMSRPVQDAKNFAEMFVFSYGVVVFWNFGEREEKDILADLTFAGSSGFASMPVPIPETAGAPPKPKAASLMRRPLRQEDVETEEFHFDYSADVARPRVFNDMITLLPRSDHMVKLTISHAIAQSTKLCFFEERMAETMLSAHGVPQNMALTGQLGVERKEVLKMMGQLFKNRVDINLSSNILDVPDFFWDAEPTLHPLYVAIRDYLEIDPRIRVLNERCRVFLDLSEILSDSIADSKMSVITWIIIVLIVVSIVIESAEIVLRTAILRKGKTPVVVGVEMEMEMEMDVDNVTRPCVYGDGEGFRGETAAVRQVLRELPEGVSLDDLRRWTGMLAEGERGYVCGEDFVDRSVGRGELR